MRVLFVADLFPWPSTKGGLIRVAGAIEALAKLAEVDLFSLYDPRGPGRVVPPGVRLRRLGTSPYPSDGKSQRWKVEWPLRRGIPLPIAMRMADPWPRKLFREFVEDRYDIVWFSTVSTWAWMGRPDLGPTIVDLIDLEDVKERQRIGLIRSTPARDAGERAVRALQEVKTRMNAFDWSRLQHQVAHRVDRVVLCSSEDVARLGVANAVVIPNTLPDPEHPVGRTEVADPPTILFQGSFDYPPNAVGARWLVDEIAPGIRTRLPGARIRLAGQSTPEVEALADEPDVTVTGLVLSMVDELARADVVLVPLRSGSGTRLKVLEAFAHRVPVVSTTIGAEGLDVVDGVHLLIADTPEAIADACERVCRDTDLRRRLADAGQALFRERFASSVAQVQIRELVDSLARRP
ncbi:MAG: glycosyltransferase [Acidimicrobiales bacterium]|jgi:glycosyltransferase involved in cell wall biosynthesis